MTDIHERHNTVIHYLLGKLDETEAEAFEMEYFGNPEALLEIDSATDDLYDLYATGALKPSDKQAFERRFLSSATDRDRLRFSQALSKWVTNSAAVRTSVGRFILSWFPMPLAVSAQAFEEPAGRSISLESDEPVSLEIGNDGFLRIQLELREKPGYSSFELSLIPRESKQARQSVPMTISVKEEGFEMSAVIPCQAIDWSEATLVVQGRLNDRLDEIARRRIQIRRG
jgi:hypothetical protein